MRSHLLNDETAEQYRRSVTEGVERVAQKIATTRRPFTGVTPDALAPTVNSVDLDRPLGDTAAALDELEEVYLRDAVYFHHPRYVAHLNCPVVIPALVGEAVLSAVNSSLDTWDQSAGGTLIERRLIDWTASRIGLGDAADGVFTSGGTQSNLQALLLAREEAKTADLAKLRIFTSESSHFSVQKSAQLLGLGRSAVVSIPTDRDRRMQTVVLAAELASLRRRGPGADGDRRHRRHHRLRLHRPAPRHRRARRRVRRLDARRRGLRLRPARLPTRRHLLDGIERADSVTVDYHKSFFQPVSSSAVLVRDGATLRHATYHADYLNPRRTVQERIPNQVDKSLQTTRRFDALKLWMTLRVMRRRRHRRALRRGVRPGRRGLRPAGRGPPLRRGRPALAVHPRLPLHPGADHLPEEIDRANLHARKALFASGEAVIAGTKVDGRQYLKFTLLNPETTVQDIAAVLDLIAGHAEQYLGENLVHAS